MPPWTDEPRLTAECDEVADRVRGALRERRCRILADRIPTAMALASLSHTVVLLDGLVREFRANAGDEMVLRILARAHLESALATLYLAKAGQEAAERLVATHRRVIEAQINAIQADNAALASARKAARKSKQRIAKQNAHIVARFGPDDSRLADEPVIPDQVADDAAPFEWYLRQFPILVDVEGISIDEMGSTVARLYSDSDVGGNHAYNLVYRSLSWMGAHPSPWVMSQYIDESVGFVQIEPTARPPSLAPGAVIVALVWTCFTAQEVLRPRGFEIGWFSDCAERYRADSEVAAEHSGLPSSSPNAPAGRSRR